MHKCLFIICGDIGIGFSQAGNDSLIRRQLTEKLSELNTKLREKECDMVLFRGNHDDPKYYNTLYNQYKLSNLILIPDYSIIQTETHNILCVGGGISIDRTSRAANLSYWKDEIVPKLSEELQTEIKNLSFNIDTVLTHNAPTFVKPINNDQYDCGPVVNNWAAYDKNLLADVWNDRMNLNELYEFIIKYHNIQTWVYGHFHEHYQTTYNDIIFIGLDMFYEYPKFIRLLPIDGIMHRMTKSLGDLCDLNNPINYISPQIRFEKTITT